MKWSVFLERFHNCAVIEPAMVYAGQINPCALPEIPQPLAERIVEALGTRGSTAT